MPALLNKMSKHPPVRCMIRSFSAAILDGLVTSRIAALKDLATVIPATQRAAPFQPIRALPNLLLSTLCNVHCGVFLEYLPDRGRRLWHSERVPRSPVAKALDHCCCSCAGHREAYSISVLDSVPTGLFSKIRSLSSSAAETDSRVDNELDATVEKL